MDYSVQEVTSAEATLDLQRRPGAAASHRIYRRCGDRCLHCDKTASGTSPSKRNRQLTLLLTLDESDRSHCGLYLNDLQ